MAQFARPNSDVTVTNWTGTPTNTTGNRYTNIDEATPSDTDYCYGANNSSTATFEAGLSSLTDPEVHTGHIVRWRYAKTAAGSLSGTGGTVNQTVGLYQGTTLIASDTVTTGGSWTAGSFTLTEGEAANISDYTNLRLRFTQSGSGGGGNARGSAVSWVELEVPDYEAPPSEGSGIVTGVATVTGVGNRDAKGSGAVSGIASASGVGAVESYGSGTVTGIASATGTGEAPSTASAEGAGTATGIASASGVGFVQRSGFGTVNAIADVSGAGKAVTYGAGTISGIGTVNGSGYVERYGAGEVTAIASASGTGQAPTVGAPGAGAGTITAVGSAVGVGYSLYYGSGTVTAIALATATGSNGVPTFARPKGVVKGFELVSNGIKNANLVNRQKSFSIEGMGSFKVTPGGGSVE
jgi:hypothetical protein